MENASKALIIAGAILLAILIIGLGVYVFGIAKGSLGNISKTMDPTKVAAYNSEFEQYEGTQSGSNARALYNVIRSHNNANKDDPTLQIVLTIEGNDFDEGAEQAAPEEPVQPVANTLKAGNTYNITFATDPNSGFITACNIRKK